VGVVGVHQSLDVGERPFGDLACPLVSAVQDVAQPAVQDAAQVARIGGEGGSASADVAKSLVAPAINRTV
jgi:hypothetical protein